MEFELNTTPDMEQDSGVQESAVDSQESQYDGGNADGDGQWEDVDPNEYDELYEEETPEADEPEEPPAEVQTRQDNQAARLARLRAQRQVQERLSQDTDREIAGAGILNPYTGKPFATLQELKDYGERVRKAEMQDQARRTGRTVEELQQEQEDRALLQELREERRRQAQQKQEAERRSTFLREDVLNFMEAHPEFDAEKLSALEKNPSFRKFCGSRFGNEPLGGLYDDYMALVGDANRAAEVRAASRTQRSTGAGGSGKAVTLTPAQQRGLDAWNRANPDMQMTASEYLRR